MEHQLFKISEEKQYWITIPNHIVRFLNSCNPINYNKMLRNWLFYLSTAKSHSNLSLNVPRQYIHCSTFC